ncbi:peptide/nickel transport system permease protein [Blastococcus aurantiacus]|uniref:Peptide/nickel transport system permease protein n=1 Tax=Blastococcus aurantiacus TaxID=1550231 RepID=A0A1G7HFD1_9ACTN|nr:ABC transporter permease [Blastococcus aurantiacus]SDE99088.1 peptide/nickel transport system permease protein [Blastococcus aurantiacus]
MYVLRRLPSLLATLFAVSLLTFLMTSLLPGDPALQILGAENATPEAIAAVRADLGLDDPLPVRYLHWIGDALTGDFGRSYRTNEPVSEAIIDRLPVTAEIGILAIIIALLVAIPVGMLSAYRAGTRTDKLISSTSFGLLAVPNFMVAIFLILIFAVWLGVLPATGWVNFTDNPVQNLRSALLPALSLAIAEMAVYTRLLRTDMIGTLQQDFVTMARVKGVSNRRILFRHALRPSSFSLMTVAGVQVGAIIGGSVVIETLFALPGVGRLLLEAVLVRDLLMVQGVALVIAVSYVVVNFTVDILYSYLDPRISHGRSAARV